MEKVIYMDPKEGKQEKTFDGPEMITDMCDFVYKLAFFSPTKIPLHALDHLGSIEIWSDGKKTLTIRP